MVFEKEGREGGRQGAREGRYYNICSYLPVSNAGRGHARRRGSGPTVDVGGDALGQLIERSHLEGL